MKKEFAIIILILLLIYFSKITGYFVTPSLNVTIKEIKDARILLNYKPIIDITEKQNITAEIVNTGSLTIQEEMFIRIYFYNKSLTPIGEYLDTINILNPGERHDFKIVFVPSNEGTYYIQAKSYYDSKTTETWGRFDVVILPIIQPVIQPPTKVSTPVPVTVYLKPPTLEIYTNDTYQTYQGGELIIPITVRNLGERDAYELKPYISYPSGLDISVSPLYVSILSPNSSVPFLLRVKVPKDFLPGLYQIVFEISANETKASKPINLNISKVVPDLTEDYREKILSLELLLSEAKRRMLYLESQGIDVSKINITLTLAENYLNNAKNYLKEKDFENCDKEISKALDLISKVLIEMETYLLITPKAYPYYIYFVIAMLILLFLFFVIILTRKRKERKPKLLRELEKEREE